MVSKKSPGPTSSLRVGGAYLLVGVIWILLSDRLLASMVPDPVTLSALQTLKGWLFVAASAALIAWLVAREVRRVTDTESRFEALAGQGIVGTFALRRGKLIYVNRRLEELFGYEKDELVGRRALELVASEDRPHVRQGERPETGMEQEVVRRKFSGLRKDGSMIQVEVFGRITSWEGEPAMAGILLDISDHAQLQDRLRQAGRLEALGEVTGAVAHDFNNFLTGILGNLDLVMADIADDPEAAEESLRMVRDAATRAASLTGQLLSFSRGRKFQHTAIDPNEHLSKLAPFLRTLCDRNQTLVLELTDSVPPILLDPVALDQLVVNLFVNAKQAAGSEGTITIRTRARASSAGNDVFVEVQDDGVGMPQEVLDHIFEPFFTTKERGTGLGLTTVRSIMDEAHGHMMVDSQPGQGTTVRLLFPEAAHALGRRYPTNSDRKHILAARSGRVLVADSDAAVARVAAVALRRAGVQTLVATDAQDVLDILHREGRGLDLVVVDADVAGLRNGHLLREVERITPDLPVLITSATRRGPAEGDPVEMVAHRPVLPKPFSVSQLLDAVDRAVARPGDDRRRSSMKGA